MLTDAQKKEYIDKGGMICPYCKSTNISTGDFDLDGTAGWQNVVCGECKQEWQDVWKLVDIDEIQL